MQFRVLGYLLQNGGACRLRVRNQAKWLHDSGPLQEISTSSPDPVPSIPDPSLAVGVHSVAPDPSRYATGPARQGLGSQPLN